MSRRGSDRRKFNAVVRSQRRDRLIYPERITQALDMCDLDGPEVDIACGGVEPMVDEWEAGTRVPTLDQLGRLSFLTGFPVGFFYRPPSDSVFVGYICGSSGCEFVDERTAAPVVSLAKDTLW